MQFVLAAVIRGMRSLVCFGRFTTSHVIVLVDSIEGRNNANDNNDAEDDDGSVRLYESEQQGRVRLAHHSP